MGFYILVNITLLYHTINLSNCQPKVINLSFNYELKKEVIDYRKRI